MKPSQATYLYAHTYQQTRAWFLFTLQISAAQNKTIIRGRAIYPIFRMLIGKKMKGSFRRKTLGNMQICPHISIKIMYVLKV